jgi:predicted nucleic acid-binding protein
LFYVDTSVLAAYYCPEPLSERAEVFLKAAGRPVISNLVEVELFSALSRKVREGALDAADAKRILARFLSQLNDGIFETCSLESHHFTLAREWLGLFTSPLRTLDALHLSIVSQNDLTIVTSDRALSKAAVLLGVRSHFLE